jgi:hypothetical protein
MWDPKTNKVSRTSSVAWAKHSLVEALSAKAPPATSDTAFQITIPLSTIESSPPRLPEQAPMQHELLQPYLGGAGVSKEDHIPELGQGHSFDGFEEQLGDDEESVSSEVSTSAPIQAPTEAPRHLDIAADLDDRLILQGTRTRKPLAKAAVLATAICLHNYTVPLYVARCFATSIIDAPSATEDNPNLLPKLVSAKQAYIHRFSKRWVLADRVVINQASWLAWWLGLVFLQASQPAGGSKNHPASQPRGAQKLGGLVGLVAW